MKILIRNLPRIDKSLKGYGYKYHDFNDIVEEIYNVIDKHNLDLFFTQDPVSKFVDGQKEHVIRTTFYSTNTGYREAFDTPILMKSNKKIANKVINKIDINNENIINNNLEKKKFEEKIKDVEKKEFREITLIIRDVITQIFALFGADNFLVLFPRMDLKGFGYVPQLFFVKPKNELITRTYNTSCFKRPVINYYDRKAEYVSYNPVMTGENISLNGGILTSLYKDMLSLLKMTVFGNTMLRFDAHLAKEQLANRLQAQVPFSIYSPTFGLKELAVITSLSFKDTPFIDEVEVSLSIEIVKTFALEKYKG